MFNLIEIISNIVIRISGIAGAIFAIYQYKKSREAEPILQIELTLTVHTGSSNNLVDAALEIKNIGKAAVYVTPAQTKNALFMVCKVSCPENPAHLVWEQFEDQKLINDVEYYEGL